jgi:multidrug efflux pump subunit AcrA (membrane-fusion protein)
VTRRTGLVAGVGLLIVAGGAGAFLRWRITHKPRQTPVAAAPVLPSEITLTGRVLPRTTILIGAPVDGVLDAYYVEIGQEVYQGQLVGRVRNPQLDDAARQTQSALDKAQQRVTALTGDQLSARLEVSRSAAEQTRAHNEVDRLKKIYDREQGLWNVGATPRLTWEKAQADYADAKTMAERQDAVAQTASDRDSAVAAQLEAANRAVASATPAVDQSKASGGAAEMHSPVDGIVIARKDLQGQPVDPSMKDLMQIGTDLTQLSVVVDDASAIPNVAARVHPGQAAKVLIGSDEFAGVVREAGPRSIIVDFTVPSALDKLDTPAQVRLTI